MNRREAGPGFSFPTAGAHIPVLDGVRGIAILLVLLYHAARYCGSQLDGALQEIYFKVMLSG